MLYNIYYIIHKYNGEKKIENTDFYFRNKLYDLVFFDEKLNIAILISLRSRPKFYIFFDQLITAAITEK